MISIQHTTKPNGFTLIELAVVIAIIAILAAVAVPRLSNLGDEAERSAAQDFLRNLRSAQNIYLMEKSTQPDTFEDFVKTTALANNEDFKISTITIGNGGCTPSGDTVTCTNADFPQLARQGLSVSYTMDANGTITLNVE